MDLEMLARTIQLIIAPAVMITSCCIFGSGLLAHYAAIGERLRVTVRERVDLLRDSETDQKLGRVVQERVEDIDLQMPDLLHHHRLVRNALFAVLVGMIFYILDMFVIAFSILASHHGLYGAILGVFLLGVGLELVGAIYAVMDAQMSHRVYAYETNHALSLRHRS